MAIDFGFSDRLNQELYGSGGPLSGGNIPQSSAPSSGSNLSQAEQLQIAQTAIDTGLKVFSSIFGAILAVDQQTGLATTQDGSQVPYDQLGNVSATETTGEVVYQADSSSGGGIEDLQLYLIGGALLSVVVLASVLRR